MNNIIRSWNDVVREDTGKGKQHNWHLTQDLLPLLVFVDDLSGAIQCIPTICVISVEVGKLQGNTAERVLRCFSGVAEKHEGALALSKLGFSSFSRSENYFHGCERTSYRGRAETISLESSSGSFDHRTDENVFLGHEKFAYNWERQTNDHQIEDVSECRSWRKRHRYINVCM